MAIVIVAVLLFAKGGSQYTINTYFINAAQLVKGDQVQESGAPIGSVKDITVTPDGQAKVKIEIKKDYAPFRVGTHATVRQASLSGIANRYVDITLPPGDNSNTKTIPSGGSITTRDTTTAVDLDQIFDMLDDKTRTSVKSLFHNSAEQFRGKTKQQRLAYKYLNPALSTSSRLFSELDRDKPRLEHFLIDSASLVTNLAQKRDDLSALIANLNHTFNALGNQRVALADSISRLPGFMRQANTTFVDLRSALDDVDPLVNATKPVAPKLNRVLVQLRPAVHDLRPTVRDLSKIAFQPGKDNDLYNLEQTFPSVAHAALDKANRSVNYGAGNKSVGNVDGAFKTMIPALKNSAPIIAFGRPYTPELMGWFDDFSATGVLDAAGGIVRVALFFNAIDATGNVPSVIPLNDRLQNLQQGGVRIKQFKRCPGGGDVRADDGSNVLSADQQQRFDCTEKARAAGAYTDANGNNSGGG